MKIMKWVVAWWMWLAQDEFALAKCLVLVGGEERAAQARQYNSQGRWVHGGKAGMNNGVLCSNFMRGVVVLWMMMQHGG